MSVPMIQQRLASYNCRTEVEEMQALREITQEVILAALGRHDFFKHAIFQGGTCLRIFHGLGRFSEDMDFILHQPDFQFELKNHLRHITEELDAFGYRIEISDKSNVSSVVKRVFLKDSSLGKILHLQHPNHTGPMAKIRIKLEVDTNPPGAGTTELRHLDFPFVSGVTVQDKPSLMAGKIHALLCRPYTKGRDWYDFIWYTSQKIEPNWDFLSSAIHQAGPWQGQGLRVDHVWTTDQLHQKIIALDWPQATTDIRRFLREAELPSLDLWGQELFLGQLRKMMGNP